MNHKAVAYCPNGHKFEFGACQMEVNKFFGGTKICGAKGFEELSRDMVQCSSCKKVYTAVPCPECGAVVPISSFRKESFFAKLG